MHCHFLHTAILTSLLSATSVAQMPAGTKASNQVPGANTARPLLVALLQAAPAGVLRALAGGAQPGRVGGMA